MRKERLPEWVDLCGEILGLNRSAARDLIMVVSTWECTNVVIPTSEQLQIVFSKEGKIDRGALTASRSAIEGRSGKDRGADRRAVLIDEAAEAVSIRVQL